MASSRMRKLLGDVLGMKYYTRPRVHKVSTGAKLRQVDCARALLNHKKHGYAGEKRQKLR